MASNATISVAPSEGTITLSGTAADDYLEVVGGAVREVHVYLDQGSAGTVGYTTTKNQVLASRDYQLVWKRSGQQKPDSGAEKVYLGGGTSVVKWMAF